MSNSIQPLADYVVAVTEEAEAKTASGFYLPEGAKEKPKTAKVVAVGPGKVGDDNKRIPMTVKVGDRIIYKQYSETTLKLDKDEYLLVREEDIIATVN